MKFTRLRIANFLTIGDSGDLNLADRGLNLIQGVNDDDPSASSNGAGKSSIPDALCWALYGQTARGETGDAVVNRTTKKGTMVAVDILDGTTKYTVTRCRKHAQGKNGLTLQMQSAAGPGCDLSKGTDRETQVEVERVLGCTYEVFKAAIYAGQEQMPDLPGMTDKQLKTLIEEAAGVQLLERAYEIARSNANAAERSIQSVTLAIANCQGAAERAAVQLEGAKLKHKEFEDSRESAALLHEGIAARMHREAQDLVADLAKMGEPALIEREKEIEASMLSFNQKQTIAANFNKEVVTGARRHRDLAESEANDTRNKAQEHRAAYDNAETQAKKPCGTCGKPGDEHDVDVYREHRKKLLVDAVAAATTAAARMQGLADTLQQAEAKLSQLSAEIPDVTALSAEQGKLRGTLRTIASIKLEARTRIEGSKTATLAAANTRSAANPQQAAIDLCTKQIEELRIEREHMETGKATLQATHEIAAAVAHVYSPAGVRAHILDTVTPFLNERTSEYLGTMSDGNISAVWSTLSRTAKNELREKFVIDVTSTTGADSFRGLSGGEKRKVRLATMMALQDLVASRATKPIDLFVGDEIDDALDEAGLERLMTVLEAKARQKGTVLVISHNSLRDWVDDVTVITKSGGVSSVAGSLVG